MNVNAVEERPRYFRNVALDHRRGAVAIARGIAEIAARAGIHGGSQHEPRWKRHRGGCARNRHRAILERLPEHFQDIPLELRKLIEEEHAVVAQ